MKALDTSVLLGLLEGERGSRDLLKKLQGVELATTEMNLLELHFLASRASPRSQSSRRQALERLRRKITVLPIDGRAVEQASRRLSRGGGRTALHVLAMLGALEANGCDELLTHEATVGPGSWRFKVTRLHRRNTE